MLWMKYGSSFFILRVHKFLKKISTHLLIIEVDFCPVLSIPKVAIL